MRCAIIEAGVVTNVILAEVPADFGAIECPDEVSPGWTYSDGEFVTPPISAPPSPSTNPADYDLFDWQLRLGLLNNGYSIEAIETTIKAIEDQADRERLWTFWDRATIIKWTNPQTQAFITFLGIPEAYAIDMWMTSKDLQFV